MHLYFTFYLFFVFVEGMMDRLNLMGTQSVSTQVAKFNCLSNIPKYKLNIPKGTCTTIVRI